MSTGPSVGRWVRRVALVLLGLFVVIKRARGLRRRPTLQTSKLRERRPGMAAPEADRLPGRRLRPWLAWVAPSLVLVLAVLAGLAATVVRGSGNWEQPSIGLALDGFRPTGGISVKVFVTVKEPTLLGCDRWADVLVVVQANKPFRASVLDALEARSARLGFALALVVPEVHGFKQELRSINEPPVPPMHADHQHIAPNLGFSVFTARDPFRTYRWDRRINWEVSFRAPLVSERGIGSCWIHLPQLIGVAAYNATATAAATFRPHGPWIYIRGAGPGAQEGPTFDPSTDFHVSRGSVGLAGSDVDVADSRPAPTDGVNTWVCTGRSSPHRGCGVLAVIEAKWRGPVRDLMLLLAGALFSVAAELLIRAVDRRHRSLD